MFIKCVGLILAQFFKDGFTQKLWAFGEKFFFFFLFCQLSSCSGKGWLSCHIWKKKLQMLAELFLWLNNNNNKKNNSQTFLHPIMHLQWFCFWVCQLILFMASLWLCSELANSFPLPLFVILQFSSYFWSLIYSAQVIPFFSSVTCKICLPFKVEKNKYGINRHITLYFLLSDIKSDQILLF